MGQPVYPYQDSRTAHAIPESVDPTPELSRSFDAHDGSVAYRLHPSQVAPIACRTGLTSALSWRRGARPARRRRPLVPRTCGALALTYHGPFQRIVRRHDYVLGISSVQ